MVYKGRWADTGILLSDNRLITEHEIGFLLKKINCVLCSDAATEYFVNHAINGMQPIINRPNEILVSNRNYTYKKKSPCRTEKTRIGGPDLPNSQSTQEEQSQ